MKKIITLLLPVAVLLFASCEKNQNFQKVVEAPATLVYVAEAGIDTPQTSTIKAIPGEFVTLDKFYHVNVNTNNHAASTATLAVSPGDVDVFNKAKGTSYKILPAENLSISAYVKPAPVEKEDTGDETTEPEPEVEEPFVPSSSATVHIAENERLSTELVRFRLGGNLSSLTEEAYLVPLRLECKDLPLSQKHDVLYVVVTIYETKVKPVESQSDIDGSLVSTRTGWTATTEDGITNLANIFTSSNTSGATFPSDSPLTFTVDMKEVHNVTGIKLLSMYASRGYTDVIITKIAYSTDGENYAEYEVDQETDLFIGSDYGANVGFYVPLEMQYVRVTAAVRLYLGSQYSSYRRLVQFYIYE